MLYPIYLRKLDDNDYGNNKLEIKNNQFNFFPEDNYEVNTIFYVGYKVNGTNQIVDFKKIYFLNTSDDLFTLDHYKCNYYKYTLTITH